MQLSKMPPLSMLRAGAEKNIRAVSQPCANRACLTAHRQKLKSQKRLKFHTTASTSRAPELLRQADLDEPSQVGRAMIPRCKRFFTNGHRGLRSASPSTG